MEYTYYEYEKYLYQGNIEACKKCGAYLLNQIIIGYSGNKVLCQHIEELCNKLANIMPTDPDCCDILFEVKRTLFSYPHN